jgi:hypothetical protein
VKAVYLIPLHEPTGGNTAGLSRMLVSSTVEALDISCSSQFI